MRWSDVGGRRGNALVVRAGPRWTKNKRRSQTKSDDADFDGIKAPLCVELKHEADEAS